jgi:hypothetical protein
MKWIWAEAHHLLVAVTPKYHLKSIKFKTHDLFRRTLHPAQINKDKVLQKQNLQKQL